MEKMENKGLLFIPDISGFTEFVTTIELAHSHHIIQELIEVLVDENEMGLEVSEIEGDAVLFYKFGDSPELSLIYEQVEKMFFAFHNHLKIYEQSRNLSLQCLYICFVFHFFFLDNMKNHYHFLIAECLKQ